MWVLLAGEDVEAILKNENARVQAASRDNGVSEGMFLPSGIRKRSRLHSLDMQDILRRIMDVD